MDADDIAKVLADHWADDATTDCLPGIGWVSARRCDCGWHGPSGEHHDHVAQALAPLVEQAKREGAAEAFASAAVGAEKLRQSNPINGDGSNHMLDRVERAIIGLADDSGPSVAAAIERQRQERRRQDDLTYWRFEAINAKARGDGDYERHALDQMALLERAAQTPRDGGGS